MALVGSSDDGKQLMILDNGFAASFKDGKWVNGILFDAYELDQHFTIIENPLEANIIIKLAKKELNQEI